jgi:ComF family protein
MVNNWKDFVRSRLYPPGCLLCGADAGADGICTPCRRDLPYNRHCCTGCALPLPATDAGRLCGQCQRQPPPFQRVFIPLIYRPPVDHLVTSFKFDGRLDCGRLLGALLAEALPGEQQDESPELLIPVPLHNSRISARGFNQALELARPVGRKLGLTVDCTTLTRIQPTPAQSGLRKPQRLRNLRTAFRLNGRVSARHLVLLDDVVTTGATAATLAKLLLRGGARRVDLWALARTPEV